MYLWIVSIRTVKVVGVSKIFLPCPFLSPRLHSLCCLRLKQEHLILFFLLGNDCLRMERLSFIYIWPSILELENYCRKILSRPIFTMFTKLSSPTQEHFSFLFSFPDTLRRRKKKRKDPGEELRRAKRRCLVLQSSG